MDSRSCGFASTDFGPLSTKTTQQKSEKEDGNPHGTQMKSFLQISPTRSQDSRTLRCGVLHASQHREVHDCLAEVPLHSTQILWKQHIYKAQLIPPPTPEKNPCKLCVPQNDSFILNVSKTQVSEPAPVTHKLMK
jgi:hypothetical protein